MGIRARAVVGSRRMAARYDNFDAFWYHFVGSHKKPATQWMHTAGVAAFCAGIATSVARRSPWPFVIGGASFAALAVGAHPLFEGNWPENTGQPIFGIVANFRMAFHTLAGTMPLEIARAEVAVPS